MKIEIVAALNATEEKRQLMQGQLYETTGFQQNVMQQIVEVVLMSRFDGVRGATEAIRIALIASIHLCRADRSDEIVGATCAIVQRDGRHQEQHAQ